jgi:hypothetical protein
MPVTKKRSKKQAESVVETPTVVPEPIAEVPNTPSNDFDEHVLLQLPLSNDQLDKLLKTEDMTGVLEYVPEIKDPEPYIPANQFMSENDTLVCSTSSMDEGAPQNCQHRVCNQEETEQNIKKNKVCFWCCHEVGPMTYGMPIRYDTLSKSFTMYGNFCSLDCAAAFNFSVHLGSDRAWEIHSWIQMLGKRYGFKHPIRPAPSRYLLQMFDGPLSIEEFRNTHKDQSRTYVLNIPPLISVNSQVEIMNTSFLGSEVQDKPKKVAMKKSI